MSILAVILVVHATVDSWTTERAFSRYGGIDCMYKHGISLTVINQTLISYPESVNGLVYLFTVYLIE